MNIQRLIIINYCIILLNWLLSSLFGEKRRAFFFAISTLQLVVFRLLLDPFLFPDTNGYANAFSYVSSMPFSEVVRPNPLSDWGVGYLIINWLLSRLTTNPLILFRVLGVAMVLGIMFIFFKVSKWPVLSIGIWLFYPVLFYQSNYVLRQHLACMLTLFALFFVSNKPKLSFIISLIAISIHTSAIVILPFYFWRRIDFSDKNTLKKVLIYGGLFFIVARFALAYVIQLFPRYDYSESGEERNLMPFLILLSLCVVHVIIGSYNRIANDKVPINYLNYLSYGVVMTAFGLGLPGGGRLSNYFIYILPIALPLLFYDNEEKVNIWNRPALVWLFSSLVIVLIIYNFTSVFI